MKRKARLPALGSVMEDLGDVGERYILVARNPQMAFALGYHEVIEPGRDMLTKARGERWTVLPPIEREGVQYNTVQYNGVMRVCPKLSTAYTFYCLLSPDRKKLHIAAGCRHFVSFRAARHYWDNRATRFDSDPAASATLDLRSLRILDVFEKKVKRLRANARAKAAVKPRRNGKR